MIRDLLDKDVKLAKKRLSDIKDTIKSNSDMNEIFIYKHLMGLVHFYSGIKYRNSKELEEAIRYLEEVYNAIKDYFKESFIKKILFTISLTHYTIHQFENEGHLCKEKYIGWFETETFRNCFNNLMDAYNVAKIGLHFNSEGEKFDLDYKHNYATILHSLSSYGELSEDITANDLLEEMKSILVENLDKDPNHKETLFSLGTYYIDIGEYDLALKYIEDSEKIDNTNSMSFETLINKLVIYFKKRDVHKTIRTFDDFKFFYPEEKKQIREIEYDLNRLKKSLSENLILNNSFSKEHINYYNELKNSNSLNGDSFNIKYFDMGFLYEANIKANNEKNLPNYILFGMNNLGLGYLINKKGEYFEVYFNSLFKGKLKYVSKDFNGFLDYLSSFKRNFLKKLPEEYLKYFYKLDEKEVFLGNNVHIVFYELNEIESLNVEYEINNYLPNHILFANNGAGTGYTINDKGQYFEIDLNSCFIEDLIYISDTFEDFISYLENY